MIKQLCFVFLCVLGPSWELSCVALKLWGKSWRRNVPNTQTWILARPDFTSTRRTSEQKTKNKQTREKQEAHIHIFQRITISWNFVSLQKRNVKTSRETSVTGRVFTDLPPSTLKGVQRHGGSF